MMSIHVQDWGGLVFQSASLQKSREKRTQALKSTPHISVKGKLAPMCLKCWAQIWMSTDFSRSTDGFAYKKACCKSL
jgi:hypothetical protein